jgi:hypothetical protein
MDQFAALAKEELGRYFLHLAGRVERAVRSLPPDKFWVKPYTYGNSIGHLVLHLTGSFSGSKRCQAGLKGVRNVSGTFLDILARRLGLETTLRPRGRPRKQTEKVPDTFPASRLGLETTLRPRGRPRKQTEKVPDTFPASIEGTGGSDHPGAKVYRMTIERMRERMIKAGLLSNDEIDQFLADGQSPELHAITAIHCSAWGRKPAQPE